MRPALLLLRLLLLLHSAPLLHYDGRISVAAIDATLLPPSRDLLLPLLLHLLFPLLFPLLLVLASVLPRRRVWPSLL